MKLMLTLATVAIEKIYRLYREGDLEKINGNSYSNNIVNRRNELLTRNTL